LLYQDIFQTIAFLPLLIRTRFLLKQLLISRKIILQ
jgi:hypothetical protein